MDYEAEMTIKELLENGTQTNLFIVNARIIERIKYLKKLDALEKKRTLRLGDERVLVNIRPKYMQGQRVKVIGIHKTKAEVQVIGEGPNNGRRFVVPFGCLVRPE